MKQDSACDAALCATTARWLDACVRSAGALALAATLAATALLALRVPLPLLAAAVLLLALPERVLALRTRLDAGLFADLARGVTTPATLDGALEHLGLRRAAAKARPLADRAQGARRLAWRHGTLALVQFALVAAQALLATRAAWP